MSTKRRNSKNPKKSGDFVTMLLVIILLAIIAAIAAYFLTQKSTTTTKPSQTELNQANKETTTSKPNQQGTQTEVAKAENKTILEGTWVSRSDGAMLEFHNSTFNIDIPSVDSPSYQKGTFSLEGTHIIFTYQNGETPCSKEKGVYTYKLTDGSLSLEVVNDNCKSRKDKLVATWDRFSTK